MQVVPVIDVMNGVVVHAAGGDRARYRPIETPLARSAEPVDVVGGLLTLHPFEVLYVADLDGITGRQPNAAVLGRLRRAFPRLSIWVDDGSSSAAAVDDLAALGVVPVVGSETLKRASDLDAIRSSLRVEPILSLDFNGRHYQGPEDLLHDPKRWPTTVIAMTLAAVGVAAGPDLASVRRIKAAKPDTTLIAAGGVRDKADLIALSQAGAWGVLVATALHSGTLKAGDLEEIAGLR